MDGQKIASARNVDVPKNLRIERYESIVAEFRKENARLRKALNDAQGKTQQHATEIILEALGK